VEKELKEKAKDSKEIRFLKTIPGISDVLASTILGEIGSAGRFSTAKKLIAYAGLDTKVVQSGEFEGTRAKLSKRGSPYLRWALYQAASIARVHDPALRNLFEKKKRKGKPYGIALSAVAQKLTHIIYSVLKNQKPYQCYLKEN
jgi:transposase